MKFPSDLHLAAAIQFLNSSDGVESIPIGRLRERLEKAIELFDMMQCDSRVEKILNMRHKVMAHWAKPVPRKTQTTYANLFNVIRRTAKIWEYLASARRGVPRQNIDEEVRLYVESADAFWKIWEQGRSAEKNNIGMPEVNSSDIPRDF